MDRPPLAPPVDARMDQALRALAAILIEIAGNPSSRETPSVSDSSRSVGLNSSESSPIGTCHAVVESSAGELGQPLPRTARSSQ